MKSSIDPVSMLFYILVCALGFEKHANTISVTNRHIPTIIAKSYPQTPNAFWWEGYDFPIPLKPIPAK